MLLVPFWALNMVGPCWTESSRISPKISYFVFRRWTNVLWVWNDVFWLNYPFKLPWYYLFVCFCIWYRIPGYSLKYLETQCKYIGQWQQTNEYQHTAWLVRHGTIVIPCLAITSTKSSCGSVVEHCVSSKKGCGFNSQETHILTKKL